MTCAWGPHILYTKALKAFKLTGVSGAYWKGDKNNKMLTRVNGIAFRNKEELAEHERLNQIGRASCRERV